MAKQANGETHGAQWVCLRCGHEWNSKRPGSRRPTACGRCRSAYWDRPRRNRVKATLAVHVPDSNEIAHSLIPLPPSLRAPRRMSLDKTQTLPTANQPASAIGVGVRETPVRTAESLDAAGSNVRTDDADHKRNPSSFRAGIEDDPEHPSTPPPARTGSAV